MREVRELQWCLSVLQFHCILINLRLSLLRFVIHSSRWIQTQRNEAPNVFFDGNLLFSFCTGNAYLNNKSNWILLFSECHLLFKSYKAGSGDLLLSLLCYVSVRYLWIPVNISWDCTSSGNKYFGVNTWWIPNISVNPLLSCFNIPVRHTRAQVSRAYCTCSHSALWLVGSSTGLIWSVFVVSTAEMGGLTNCFEGRYGLFSSTHSLVSLSPAKLFELLSQFNYMLQSFWAFFYSSWKSVLILNALYDI